MGLYEAVAFDGWKRLIEMLPCVPDGSQGGSFHHIFVPKIGIGTRLGRECCTMNEI